MLEWNPAGIHPDRQQMLIHAAPGQDLLEQVLCKYSLSWNHDTDGQKSNMLSVNGRQECFCEARQPECQPVLLLSHAYAPQTET